MGRAFEHFPNLVAAFFTRAREMRDTPFLWAKRDGAWRPTSWQHAAGEVAALAAALKRLGLDRGDRVMLVSENRPEWAIADLAIMTAGCVSVPAYTTNTERDHAHVLTDSGAKAAIVSTARLAAPLLAAIGDGGECEHVISIDPLDETQGERFRVHHWQALTDTEAVDLAVYPAAADFAREELACIIYTSGTGGAPRGVMLHHGSILHNVEGAAAIIAEDFGWDNEVFLSFLPLSHAYEHSGGLHLPIWLGAQIYYAESLERLASNIEEVRPTIMIVVPRLFEMLRQRMVKAVEKQGRVATLLFRWALALGARNGAGRVRPLDWPLHVLLEHSIRPKIRARFGGRIKALVSGGAPLNPEVGIFFHSLGLTLLQGYGQTEAGPIVSCNRPSVGLAMDTVGPPIRGAEVQIAEDGEILVRGELVMQGYWRNPELTASTKKYGWLHTGDIGLLDEAGRLKITDRKKDLIVNDKGDNVAPQRVEGMLTLQLEIAQAMVSGDKKPWLVGLIVPDPEWTAGWAKEQGKDNCPALRDDPDYHGALSAAVDRVNAGLSVIERIRSFILADEPFTIENQQLTPSIKIRRHVLREVYGERLEALYRK